MAPPTRRHEVTAPVGAPGIALQVPAASRYTAPEPHAMTEPGPAQSSAVNDAFVITFGERMVVPSYANSAPEEPARYHSTSEAWQTASSEAGFIGNMSSVYVL